MSTWRVSILADYLAVAALSGTPLHVFEMACDPDMYLGEVEAETKGAAIQRAFAEFRSKGVTASNLIVERMKPDFVRTPANSSRHIEQKHPERPILP